jgi:hypothetical protein
MAHIGKFADAVCEPENKENGGVNAELNPGVAFLDFGQSGPANRGTLRHYRRRNAAAAAGVADVRTQFVQDAGNRDGN